jgi:C4-dicarboxylate transporter DctM subunit
MSNFGAGLASFLILLSLLAVRVPIGVAMLAVGTGGFIWIQGLAPLLSFYKTTPFETFSTYSFSVIPLFLLMGNVASSAGLSARLFRGANALLGHRKGGMAMAAVGACAAFGTICGSSLATAATMGQVALPEMRKYGYSGSLATGTLAAGGTLGILVPPSIPLVVYAILTEQNIAKLFLAAFLPAALAVLGFFIAIRGYLLFNPQGGPASAKLPFAMRARHIGQTWPVAAIFVIVSSA